MEAKRLLIGIDENVELNRQFSSYMWPYSYIVLCSLPLSYCTFYLYCPSYCPFHFNFTPSVLHTHFATFLPPFYSSFSQPNGILSEKNFFSTSMEYQHIMRTVQSACSQCSFCKVAHKSWEISHLEQQKKNSFRLGKRQESIADIIPFAFTGCDVETVIRNTWLQPGITASTDA